MVTQSGNVPEMYKSIYKSHLKYLLCAYIGHYIYLLALIRQILSHSEKVLHGIDQVCSKKLEVREN